MTRHHRHVAGRSARLALARPSPPGSASRLPKVLAPWVNLSELQDSKADPRLREETDLVARVRASEGDEVDQLERHRLNEHPEVLAAWADYQTRWERSAVEDRRLEPVMAAYTRLFEIEQLAGQL